MLRCREGTQSDERLEVGAVRTGLAPDGSKHSVDPAHGSRTTSEHPHKRRNRRSDKVTDFSTRIRNTVRFLYASAIAASLTGAAPVSWPAVSSVAVQSTSQPGAASSHSYTNGDPQASSSRPSAPGEMLYPGDIVRLRIYREPDLSGDYEINAQGIAVFPKIGSIQVSQITTDSLQRLLVATYSQYLRDPAIEVTPLRRVTVLGSVKNPGVYPVDPTMTIADALALAGGPSADGNQKKVQIIRGGKKVNVTVTVHQEVAQTPIRSGDELYVPERSWISRNGYIVGAAIGAATIIATTVITHY
jgi:protein involved in polysaccharide export with SLBB domain